MHIPKTDIKIARKKEYRNIDLCIITLVIFTKLSQRTKQNMRYPTCLWSTYLVRFGTDQLVRAYHAHQGRHVSPWLDPARDKWPHPSDQDGLAAWRASWPWKSERKVFCLSRRGTPSYLTTAEPKKASEYTMALRHGSVPKNRIS
jgi:hypothetical protein